MDRHDVAALMTHFADGEGMYYYAQLGRMNTESAKKAWRAEIEVSAKLNEKVSVKPPKEVKKKSPNLNFEDGAVH